MDWNILDIYIRVLFGRYPPSRFANFFPFSFPFPFQNSLLQQNRHPSHPIQSSSQPILYYSLHSFSYIHSHQHTTSLPHYLTTSLPHYLTAYPYPHLYTTTLQHYNTTVQYTVDGIKQNTRYNTIQASQFSIACYFYLYFYSYLYLSGHSNNRPGGYETP